MYYQIVCVFIVVFFLAFLMLMGRLHQQNKKPKDQEQEFKILNEKLKEKQERLKSNITPTPDNYYSERVQRYHDHYQFLKTIHNEN